MQFGLHIPIHRTNETTQGNFIDYLSKRVLWGESIGFQYISVLDHLTPFHRVGNAESQILDCWTILGALAAITSSAKLMPLVSNSTLRHPSMIAKSSASLDLLSNGRMQLGIGAGGYKPEYLQHGFPYPSKSERYEILDESIQIIRQLWSGPDQYFQGIHHQLSKATISPRPTGSPSILVGGNSQEILNIAASKADAVNMVMPNHADLQRNKIYLDQKADVYGRPSVQLTTLERIVLGKTESEAHTKLNQLSPTITPPYRGLIGSTENVVTKITDMQKYGVGTIYVFFEEEDEESYDLFERKIINEFYGSNTR